MRQDKTVSHAYVIRQEVQLKQNCMLHLKGLSEVKQQQVCHKAVGSDQSALSSVGLKLDSTAGESAHLWCQICGLTHHLQFFLVISDIVVR